MPKRDPALMKRLRQALRAKDMQSMTVICMQFPTVDKGIAAFWHLLQHEMPADIRRWWVEEECDLPHSTEALTDEALLLLTRVIMERERRNPTDSR